MLIVVSFSPHPCFEDIHSEFPGIYRKPELFSDVCGLNVTTQFNIFWIFFDRLVGNVAGRKIWTNKDKVGERITVGGKITIVDEAFTILCIENYWDRWFNQRKAKWTDSRQGNSQYMGWAEAAYMRFDFLCRRIQEQRQSENSNVLEIAFMQQACNEYVASGGSSRKKRRAEPTIKFFNELG
jgi:hypothetical protein